MRLYGGRIINSKMRREISIRQELRDAVVYDIDSTNKYCRVKIQGSDTYVKAYYNENWGSQPEWLKPGNAVRITHPGGNKGRIEVVGHGLLLPTAVPGGSVAPPAEDDMDAVLDGCSLSAPTDEGMTAWVSTGTYRLDGVTYTLSGMTMDNATVEMDRADLFIDEVGGSVAFDAAHATLFRYDLIVVGTDGVLDVVKGDNASGEPTLPSVPVDHVQCGFVLIYPGMTKVGQSVINKYYSESLSPSLVVTLSDDDLAWGEHTSTITIKVCDQYERAYPGTYTALVKIMPFGTGSLSGADGAAYEWRIDEIVSIDTPGTKGWLADFTETLSITYTREDGAPAVAESSGYIVVEETNHDDWIAMEPYTLRDSGGNILQKYGVD